MQIIKLYSLFWTVIFLTIGIFAVIELLDDDLKDKDLRRERKN